MQEPASTIALELKRARGLLNLSQQQAATKAGLTTRTWATIEAGENVRLDTLLAALDAVGLTFELVDKVVAPAPVEAVG